MESSYLIQNEMRSLLEKIYNYASCRDVHSVKVFDMVHLFVDESYSCRFVPLVVYSSAKPSQAQRFLVHILVSMGIFDCEYDLYQGRCVSDLFFNAGLLSRRPTRKYPVSQDDVDRILKEYIMRQILFLPGGTKSFDRYCEIAREVLTNALIHGVVSSVGTLEYLYTSLLCEANDECVSF